MLDEAGAVLLVENRRRGGATDWTPPGGVIEVEGGEGLLAGLAREVEEETGLRITRWGGMLWSVSAEAPGMGWQLHAEIHLAAAWEGELRVADPDGIVVDARFVPPEECAARLDGGHPWVCEPMAAWLAERWVDSRPFGYRIDGESVAGAVVTRLA